MAWTYFQESGELAHGVAVIGTGYSGLDYATNNPRFETVAGVGPIPRGFWQIGDAVDLPNLGPVCLPLTPEPETDTFGRGGFFIHGDSREHPGEASHGCIVMERPVREQVSVSTDRRLEVV